MPPRATPTAADLEELREALAASRAYLVELHHILVGNLPPGTQPEDEASAYRYWFRKQLWLATQPLERWTVAVINNPATDRLEAEVAAIVYALDDCRNEADRHGGADRQTLHNLLMSYVRKAMNR